MGTIFYRVAHRNTKQGLWYDSDGKFTGLIHKVFDFCANRELPMPFDPDIVGWLSATETLEELFYWFPKEDIKKLEDYGWFITAYETDNFKQYKNHIVICQETSRLIKTIPLAEIETEELQHT